VNSVFKILLKPVEDIGGLTIRFFESVGEAVVLLFKAIYLAFIPPYDNRLLARQCEIIGLSSLPVVAVVNMFVGMVFALNSFAGFNRFGASDFTAPVVALAITREMAPVMTALIVAGRAGSAMAAEIGTMKVTEQIDALWTLATNPINYLVVPRILAATIMLPTLCLFADAIGIWGGYIVSVGIMGQNPQIYIQGTWNGLIASDVIGGLFKATVFGFLLALTCCHFGFATKGGAEGVGRSTTQSVVFSFIIILIADFFLTRILNWG
jgi:phospholipid/cholesterol/gamma-HCH transport system permease protein